VKITTDIGLAGTKRVTWNRLHNSRPFSMLIHSTIASERGAASPYARKRQQSSGLAQQAANIPLQERPD
jgi:hypothetical protein